MKLKNRYENHLKNYSDKSFPIIYHKDFISADVSAASPPGDVQVINYNENRPHYHEGLEILQVLSGRMGVLSGEDSFEAAAGDIVVINSGDLHRNTAKNCDCVYRCLILNFELCGQWGFDLQQVRFKSHITDDKIASLMEDIAEEMENGRQFYKPMVLARSTELLVRLSRSYRVEGFNISDKKTELVRKILVYINRNYASSASLDDLSRELGYSRFYISRTFTEETGISLTAHINRTRIHKAQKLLAAGEHSISEIAELCGYPSSSAFGVQFKKAVGCSPGRYRKYGE